jgi:hypothetical protein
MNQQTTQSWQKFPIDIGEIAPVLVARPALDGTTNYPFTQSSHILTFVV